ncbi:hypothetical protein [Phytobacter diazotrophicus]|uniref:hypothetical protein n=1 Tax=Phytobacter diazotrophicus TaxID=395631 RepID=UPI002936543E|nr:hypothetical protein [Phytobacter diazotrophicus]MDV2871375.1 hypothetical protein [Phytobacter diazotrophicus]
MNETNVFELVKLIKAAKGDPSAITDAIWEAGYRQPERTAEEAAKITIDVFFHCNAFGISAEFWPDNYDSILLDQLMAAVGGKDGEFLGGEPSAIAKSVIAAGFAKKV